MSLQMGAQSAYSYNSQTGGYGFTVSGGGVLRIPGIGDVNVSFGGNPSNTQQTSQNTQQSTPPANQQQNTNSGSPGETEQWLKANAGMLGLIGVVVAFFFLSR
jgi:hypothetical protein